MAYTHDLGVLPYTEIFQDLILFSTIIYFPNSLSSSAGAYPSCHGVIGGIQPGLVTKVTKVLVLKANQTMNLKIIIIIINWKQM